MKNITVMRKLAKIDREFMLLRKLFLGNATSVRLGNVDMLRLNGTEIKSLIALRCVGGHGSASDVAKVLGVQRAMASKHLCVLHKVGYVEKYRVGHAVKFRLIVKEGGLIEA